MLLLVSLSTSFQPVQSSRPVACSLITCLDFWLLQLIIPAQSDFFCFFHMVFIHVVFFSSGVFFYSCSLDFGQFWSIIQSSVMLFIIVVFIVDYFTNIFFFKAYSIYFLVTCSILFFFFSWLFHIFSCDWGVITNMLIF